MQAKLEAAEKRRAEEEVMRLQIEIKGSARIASEKTERERKLARRKGIITK